MAWSLKGFAGVVEKISARSIEFHSKRGDFEKWAERSLSDRILAVEFKKTRLAELRGERLRTAIIRVVEAKLDSLRAEVQSATRYF
jgi:hypothetical protein